MYARHYEIEDSYLVQPEDIEKEKAAYWKDWQRYYKSRDEAEEDLDRAFGQYGNFPPNEELDELPNSTAFWEEAKRQEILSWPGVKYAEYNSLCTVA